MKRLFFFTFGLWIFSSSSLYCQSQTVALGMPDITLWSRMTIGRVVSSQCEMSNYDNDFNGVWLENVDGGIKLNRQITPSILARLNMGITVSASRPRQVKGNKNNVELTAKMFSATLLDASVQYTRNKLFGSFDNLLVEFGYFPFKYNPQSTSLGEYLFRTGTYPGVIISGFENSNIDRPKIAGIHGAWGIAPYVNVDALLNTELEIYPLHDINATVIATGTWPKILTLGLGVQFARLITEDAGKTTPGLDTIRYSTKFKGDLDYIGYVDTATHDTTLYTFKGTKLMGRATLDIKGIIETFAGDLPVFGKEDLKLYGEAAVLGVQNYPGWYNKLSERIPMMAGINIPTFKLFDVLSIEVEKYTCPYWNSQNNIWRYGMPIPYTANDFNYDSWTDSLAQTNDDIKWSIYASKKIGSWLRLSGQIACDHTPRNWYTLGTSQVQYTEMVPRSWDWYFMLRTSFYF